MRPAGEENEAGFEELLMRRICVGTGSRTRNTEKVLCAVRVSKKPGFRRRPEGARVTQQ